MRLVGGNSSLEGSVEIFQNNQWGTVCGLLWDEADARVVCRQLGFSSVGKELSTCVRDSLAWVKG